MGLFLADYQTPVCRPGLTHPALVGILNILEKQMRLKQHRVAVLAQCKDNILEYSDLDTLSNQLEIVAQFNIVESRDCIWPS